MEPRPRRAAAWRSWPGPGQGRNSGTADLRRVNLKLSSRRSTRQPMLQVPKAQPGDAWQIRLETQDDWTAVEALNESVFGAGRFAKSAYRLREGVSPVAELSFVA